MADGRRGAGFGFMGVGEERFLELPEESYNPTILRWRDRVLVGWRIGWGRGRVGLGELTADGTVAGVRELDFSGVWEPGRGDALEDPRLFEAFGRVHVVYTHLDGRSIGMGLAVLDEGLRVEWAGRFAPRDRRAEKNWQFFQCGRELHAVYGTNPHTVGCLRRPGAGWYGGELRVPPADGAVLPWAWGEPRGGTPPVRVGDEYFSFFHSMRDGEYVAGFYGFEARPPFRVTRWPEAPCLRPRPSPSGRWLQVVFPGGAVHEDGEWLVAYGWNDERCALARFRHADLLAGLTARVPSGGQGTRSGRERETSFPLAAMPRPSPPVVPLAPAVPGPPEAGAGCIFVLTVHAEPVAQVMWCLERLRQAMPAARVVVIGDGPGEPEYPVVAAAWGARHVAGENLKRERHGGRWLARLFTEALREDGAWIFKIDADAAVWRAFRERPAADYFGHLVVPGDAGEHVQGGCCGFSRAYAENVLASGILDEARWTSRRHWTLGAAGAAWLAQQAPDYLCTDALQMQVARAMGVTPVDWEEVRHEATDVPGDRAVTHPHKGQVPPLASFPDLTWPAAALPAARCKARAAFDEGAIRGDDYDFLRAWTAQEGAATVVAFEAGEAILAFLERDCWVIALESDAERAGAVRKRFADDGAVQVRQWRPGLSREPALSGLRAHVAFVSGARVPRTDGPARLWECLAAGAVSDRVILHEARRRGEQLTARLMESMGWRVRFVPTRHGVVVMEK